jgi:hypothetical protein
MRKFKTNRNGFIKTLLLASLMLPIIVFFLSREEVSRNLIVTGLTLTPLSFFLWIYFGTYYILEDKKLFYKSAFVSGQIDVTKIREIIKGRTTWTGIKPATAAKGLLIKFNTYDEIYISPEDNDSLIEALKEINDKIRVME